MSKIAVVYWSGTGNTKQMANLIKEGAEAAEACRSMGKALAE